MEDAAACEVPPAAGPSDGVVVLGLATNEEAGAPAVAAAEDRPPMAEPAAAVSMAAQAAATPAPLPEAGFGASAAPGPTPAQAAGAEQEFEAVQDFTSEPLEARLGSKDINRRCSAYAELQASMDTGSDAEAFAVFWKNLDVCIGETLPKAQDAALSALSKYLERCPDVEATAVLPLVRRLLEHKSIDKPKMQMLVPPVLLAVAEICECPAVVTAMLECLTALDSAKKKVQGFFKKQVAFIIRMFFQLLSEFGAAKISPKLGYVPVVIKYITDKESLIREACYSMLVELSCWLGDISGAVSALEEPQRKELIARVEKLGDEEKKRTEIKRRYRGEKVEVGVDTAKVSALPLDAHDMVEAVDAQKKLPKGWCITKIFTMEKWKEKHEHLQVLSVALDAPRLAPCNFYADLAPSFVRLLKTECNIPIMTEAAKCVGLMARGLRKEFERPARQLLPIALRRINDKSVWKPNVLIERVEQLLWSVPFELLFEELRPHVASKSLFVKKEAMSLLLRSFDLPQVQQSCSDVAQKFLCPVAAAVLPNIDDADNTVRQEAARLLAQLAHRNPSSPDVVPCIMNKVPATRRNFFDEEMRKVGKELGVSCDFTGASVGQSSAAAEADAAESQTNASLPSHAAGPTATEGRSRPESPGAARGRPVAAPQSREQRLAAGSPSKRTIATPRTRGLALTPCSQQQTQADAPSALSAAAAPPTLSAVSGRVPAHVEEDTHGSSAPGAPAVPSSAAPQTLAPASAAEVNLMEVMAEEIRSLNAKVMQLEAQQDQTVRQEPASPKAAAVQSRGMLSSRTARGGASGGGAQSSSSLDTSAVIQPRMTRAMTPSRAQSADRSALTRAHSSERSIAAPNSARLRRQGSVESLQSNGQAPTEFKLEPPRQGKNARQLKERSLYWGTDQIPAEHLANLKELFRTAVDPVLCKNMFSDRMEEVLQALQCWKKQIPVNFDKICEVLDMVLKWLTWVLFTSNTQTWKLTLELVNSLLDGLNAAGTQLTDREAQILVPHIVERSGHNNLAIRDGMMQVLMQCMQAYTRFRMLPMLLHGLASKNKRSTNCALRAIADCFDRQVAFQLLRSQKDVVAIVKMLDDKDTELRKAALNILALLSQYTESDAFSRGCGRHLSKDQLALVRGAAARLAPVAMGEGASTMDVSQLSASHLEDAPRATGTRAATPSMHRNTRAATPTKQRFGAAANTSMEANTGREATPTRRRAAAVETNARREYTPTRSHLSRTSGSGTIDTTEANRISSPLRRQVGDESQASSTRLATPTRVRETIVANVTAEACRRSNHFGTPGRPASMDRGSPRRPASLGGGSALSPEGSRMIRPRISSPLRQSQSGKLPLRSEVAAEAVTPAPAPAAALKASPSPSPISIRSTSPRPRRMDSKAALLESLSELSDPNTDPKTFKELCETICRTFKERTPDSYEFDAFLSLGGTLLGLLQTLVKESSPEEKFKSTLQILEAFCEQPEWKRAQMGHQTIFDLIREFLRYLNKRGLGRERLQDVNVCFVKCLTNLQSRTAYWALLETLKEEDKCQGLVSKCLKKVEKKAGVSAEGCSEEKAEREGRSAIEAVLCSRLSVGPLRFQAWLEGAKEVVDISRRCAPQVLDDCVGAALANAREAEEQRLLEDLWGRLCETKENSAPTAEVLSKTSEQKAFSQSRDDPAPCAARNVIA